MTDKSHEFDDNYEDDDIGDSEESDDDICDADTELEDAEIVDDSEFIEPDNSLHTIILEDVGYCFELTIRVTPASIDGRRHVDIMDAFDMRAKQYITRPRMIIKNKTILNAVDLLIWSIMQEDEMTEEQKNRHLGELQ